MTNVMLLFHFCDDLQNIRIMFARADQTGFIARSDQTGFMQNRYIGEHICLVLDSIKYNIPGVIIYLDFDKAFDKLEWSLIENVGPNILRCVSSLYHNISSCVTNNGHVSSFSTCLLDRVVHLVLTCLSRLQNLWLSRSDRFLVLK